MMANVALSRIFLRKLLLLVPLWLGAVNALSYPGGDGSGSSFPNRPGRTDWDDAEPNPLSDYSDVSDSEYNLEDAPNTFGSSQQAGRPLDKNNEMDSLQDFDDNDDGSFSFQNAFQSPIGDLAANDKETMYEAYNQLHTLAQEYAKPFDAPAVVVVGHQSSGKSALIEALMGFQFNQVGGGTKTRRPVALRMQYNPKCSTPRWFLVGDDGVERPMSLKDIQDYIERENKRLERDPMKSFDGREINLRMEYKHCPNMILIDTPGLISAPKTPRGKYASGTAMAQQRALQASAKEAERLVVEKMKCEDYIILCVEDTSDWKHGTTREVVQKADPDLSRTVIVNTKFDTKLPQFGTPKDAEEFLRAKILDRISPHRLGGPFYTSVPSGRVGRAHNALSDGANYMYNSDEAFVQSLREAEDNDQRSVVDRMNRIKYSNEVTNTAVTTKVGLGRLRTFLEQRVDECYRRNINKIIPMLQAEYNAAERRLEACEKEIDALSVERLRAGAEAFCDDFCKNLQKAMQGSITAPSSVFGETLGQESASSGAFHNAKNYPMAVSDRTWERLVDAEVGNRDHRLYGGAQYHRSLREFSLAAKCLRTPLITEDEIANAAGVGATHDGVNFLHASCVIALEKAQKTFEPLLGTLVARMTHVMSRLCPVTEYMLREDRDRGKLSNFQGRRKKGDSTPLDQAEHAMDISQNPRFRELVRSIFEKFVEQRADAVILQCRDDVIAITKYVTWNLDQKGVGAITGALPDKTDLVSVYKVAVKQQQKAIEEAEDNGNNKKKKKKRRGKNADDGVLTPIDSSRGGALSPRDQHALDRDYHNLVQIMEEAAMTRSSNRTNIVVGGLVQHIVFHWREQFCRAVITKFNCYFMLPFVENFHKFLRTELQKLYSGDEDGLSDVFDITAARRALELHRDELQNECMANKELQDQFEALAKMMKRQKEIDVMSGHAPSKKKRSLF